MVVFEWGLCDMEELKKTKVEKTVRFIEVKLFIFKR